MAAALVVSALATGVLAGSAQAFPQGHFACFATAIHTDRPLNSLLPSDPLIANPLSAPCQADARSAPASATNGTGGSTTVAASSASASTANTQDYNPAENYTPVVGDNGSAQTSAQSVVIVSGATVIKADALSARATVTCTSVGSSSSGTTGSFALAGSATVGDLTINGNPVALTGGPQTIPTPAGTLYVDAAYQPVSFALFQRALWLQTSSGDVIAGEAAVAAVGQPCQNGAPPPPPAPIVAFGCWGSALQYTINYTPERPFVANPAIGPCVDSHGYAVSFGFASDFVSVDAPYARTTNSPDPLPSSPPYPGGATSTASAGAGAVHLGPAISANAVASTATVSCSAGTFVLGGSSQVHGLRVAGIAIPDTGAPMNIKVLGGTLHLNWTGTAPNYVEHRALWFESTIGYDVVVGDSIAGVNRDSAGNPLNPC